MQEEKTEGTAEKQQVVGRPFPPGVSGNPNGRPKGTISIKEKIRQYLNDHPDEVDKIVKYFTKDNRELMWQMLEGRPQQDVVSDGERIIPLPILGFLTSNGGKSDGEGVLLEDDNKT